MASLRKSEEAASVVIVNDVAEAMAGVVLRLQGPARIVLIGESLSAVMVARFLLAAGCEVELVVDEASALPAEASVGVAVHLGLVAWSAAGGWADVALVMHAPAEIPSHLLDLNVQSLLLVAPFGVAAPGRWWEMAASRGWALHSAAWVMHESIDGHSTLALARQGVQLGSSTAVLQASLFALGAALVREGDDVLLHAPDTYGAWRIVLEQSRCGWLAVAESHSNAEVARSGGHVVGASMDLYDGRPVDFLLASMPSSEAVGRLLEQAARIVRRSGRLLIGWGGTDVAGWDEKCDQLETFGFAVDRAWLLRGGAQAAPMSRVELDLSRPLASQWLGDDVLAVLAVRVDGARCVQLPDSDAPNIIAFQRDYHDASIVRLIVAMGHRIESSTLRRVIALRVLDEAPEGSADQGAALCVLLYDRSFMQSAGRPRILRMSEDYLDGRTLNPTAFRWKVSISFALGRLFQGEGRAEDAVRQYEYVLAQDVLQFSPLLGTKTTSAALSLGWLAFARRDLVSARQAWSRCLEEARRLANDSDWRDIVGDPARPETFGMPEFAAVMDEAATAAAALRLTAEVPLRSGLAWEWANRSWRQQIGELRREISRHLAWRDELQQGKDWLDAQYRHLTSEVARLSADRSSAFDQHERDVAACRLAQEQIEEALGHQRRLYADLLAAYRLARHDAEQRCSRQRQQYDDLLANYRLSHANAERQQNHLRDEYERLQAQHAGLLAERDQYRKSASDRLALEVRRVAEHEARYQGLRSAYRLARVHSDERIALLQDRYAGVLAAYGTARMHSRREVAELNTHLEEQQARAAELEIQLGRLGDDHEVHRGIHARLVQAASKLGAACGQVMGTSANQPLKGDALAGEMERLAGVINALPLRGLLRILFRLLRRVSGLMK